MTKTFLFSPSIEIPAAFIFAEDEEHVAFVNLKPLHPFHFLACQRRSAVVIGDLTKEEYMNLMSFARQIRDNLELFTNDLNRERHAFLQISDKEHFQMAIQDGKSAGQSVEHVHVHIIPDIKNVPNDDDRSPQSYEDMSDQCEFMRRLVKKYRKNISL